MRALDTIRQGVLYIIALVEVAQGWTVGPAPEHSTPEATLTGNGDDVKTSKLCMLSSI
jgi:hypothetical protein